MFLHSFPQRSQEKSEDVETKDCPASPLVGETLNDDDIMAEADEVGKAGSKELEAETREEEGTADGDVEVDRDMSARPAVVESVTGDTTGLTGTGAAGTRDAELDTPEEVEDRTRLRLLWVLM